MADHVVIHKTQPIPVLWRVECPQCDHGVEVLMNEQDDGRTFKSGDWMGDPFVTCDVCGAVIEPVAVCLTKHTG